MRRVRGKIAMKKIPCSVEILTFNNEKTIRRTLESVKDFDEIVIVDGGSTDGTLAIAREYGCAIISQDMACKNEDGTIKDFAAARNQGLARARNVWFLFVDSDEYMGAGVVREIGDVARGNATPAGYFVPRKYVFDGRMIECALAYPSFQMRLFHKDAAEKFIKEVHERIKLKNGTETRRLAKPMFVPISVDIRALRKKQERYIAIEQKREGNISIGRFLFLFYHQIKIIMLYLFRMARNAIGCHGSRLPFSYEWGMILYHFKLCAAFARCVRIRKQTWIKA